MHPWLQIAFGAYHLTNRVFVVQPKFTILGVGLGVVALRLPANALAVLVREPELRAVLEVLARRALRRLRQHGLVMRNLSDLLPEGAVNSSCSYLHVSILIQIFLNNIDN